MPLKLMYITNSPEVALCCENAGVDRIFVDMEYIGKSDRQGGMNTVQNRHTIQDVITIRSAVKKAELLVRCNPIHPATNKYSSSYEEIDKIVKAGADVIMLPYFKTIDEVKLFLNAVDGRARTMLLFETPQSVEIVDEILSFSGIDEAYIGLNDLSLGYGKRFMFEPLGDGTVDLLCEKFKQAGVDYGFGGIASLGNGLLPAELIIGEHYRLGSTRVILSRSFCNIHQGLSNSTLSTVFADGIERIREYEASLTLRDETWFENNRSTVCEKIKIIAGSVN